MRRHKGREAFAADGLACRAVESDGRRAKAISRRDKAVQRGKTPLQAYGFGSLLPRWLAAICATLLLCSFLAGVAFGQYQSRTGGDTPLILILDGKSGADYFATYHQLPETGGNSSAEPMTVNFDSLPVV